ncbi:MAG: alpha-L-fucosidase [Bacteroidota bacterium]
MKFLLLLCLFSLLLACQPASSPSSDIPPTYEADWASLAAHQEAPVWFQDAKFGIYFHWGVYSVPAYGDEWYPRWMHTPGHHVYEHHEATYGPVSEFGYHDFVPMFKAEKFDAEAWASLFQEAGARFAGPVAEHHDGFSMWDSEVTPWNAGKKGPKKDITGLLSEALKKRGMKLITTFHHAKHLQRYTDSTVTEEQKQHWRTHWNSHYPFFPPQPQTQDDPELKYLYGNLPEEQWLEEVWLAKVQEVTEKYQPDIIWFDSWLDQIPEAYRRRMAADYLNKAEKWGKEVVIVRKQDDLPLDMSVDDLEKSRKNELDEKVWMTDETVSTGSWCYTENLEVKPMKDVLHVLIDIVSKNGVLLLNVSPKADGTIPENQQAVLKGMGNWLATYGEGIYGSRPWYTYGEGPTKEPEGNFENHAEFLKIKYSWKDVRYTTQDQVLYAFFLGWPEKEIVVLEAFAEDQWTDKKPIKAVEMMNYEGEVQWSLQADGLHLSMPDTPTDTLAPAVKVFF